jgi:tetratricopeptide (TPR) repeat protein
MPMLKRSLSLALRATSKISTANVLQEIARQELLIGEYVQATSLLDEALDLHLQVGFRIGEGNVYWERGRIAFAHGRHEEARGLFTKSLDIFVEIGAATMEAGSRQELAKLHHATGELAPVEALLDQALRIHVETSYAVGEAEVRNSIAAYRADVDGPEVGLKLYQEAHEVAVGAEHPLERARGLEGMARCEVELGMVEAGVGHLREAVDLYGRMKVVEYRPAAAWLTELTGG